MREIYGEAGLRGFFKGLSASYAGVSETVLQFVIYEKLKSILEERKNMRPGAAEAQSRMFLLYCEEILH